jgi:hypothetical protein
MNQEGIEIGLKIQKNKKMTKGRILTMCKAMAETTCYISRI